MTMAASELEQRYSLWPAQAGAARAAGEDRDRRTRESVPQLDYLHRPPLLLVDIKESLSLYIYT